MQPYKTRYSTYQINANRWSKLSKMPSKKTSARQDLLMKKKNQIFRLTLIYIISICAVSRHDWVKLLWYSPSTSEVSRERLLTRSALSSHSCSSGMGRNNAVVTKWLWMQQRAKEWPELVGGDFSGFDRRWLLRTTSFTNRTFLSKHVTYYIFMNIYKKPID